MTDSPSYSSTGATRKLFIHATIITVNKTRDVILDGALLISNGRISSLGKTTDLLSHTEALSQHNDEKDNKNNGTNSSIQIIDCNNKIILPGLINTHAHLAQSLLRGLAEDLPLHSWLCDAIWPLEANYADEDGYTASSLTIAEMLKTGTTCFLEAMLTHRSGVGNVVRAVEEMGIRACLGKLVKAPESNPDLNMKDARDRDVDAMSIDAALETYKKYHGSCNDRLHIWLAAGTPRGSPMSGHAAIGEAAQKHNMGLTMHCAEAPKDLTIYREYYQTSPFEFCQRTKLTGAKSVFAHCVHPDPAAGDFSILRDTQSTVSHNPTSNLKLGSGIAPIPDMIAAGVNISLGTDGAPCNNTYDMWREMHLASILHGGARQEAGILTAYDVLEFATINGARALGLEQEIGSLEVNKKADIIVVTPNGPSCAPWSAAEQTNGGIDPVTMLVHSGEIKVEYVLVDGEVLVQNGELVMLDEEDLVQRARTSIQGIRSRSNVVARNHMSLNYI